MKRKKIELKPRKRGYWDSKVEGVPIGEGWEDITVSEYLCIYRAMRKLGYTPQREKMRTGKFRVWRDK